MTSTGPAKSVEDCTEHLLKGQRAGTVRIAVIVGHSVIFAHDEGERRFVGGKRSK